MQRSRKRKLRRERQFRVIRHGFPMATGLLAAMLPAIGQDRSGANALPEIIVTAQKREERLQDVPISVQALDTEKLDQLRVSDFDDYVKFLPSVSFQQLSPGFARIFMRGVSSGDNGNHSGPLPSVGSYLDEQPITTIQGPLDLHIYDIARVESLAGPQGTLYGASSLAGTIRIITNKPTTDAFSAAYNVEGNAVSDGDAGYQFEGFVNVPLTDKMAVRLVGWHRHDAGFIDNVFGTRTFLGLEDLTGDGTVDNAGFAESDYNDADTTGARAALRIELNDSWTVTPSLIAQQQDTNGFFGFDPDVGDLKMTHFYPETSEDKFVQAALTVEGKVSNFDIVYAGSYLDRKVDVEQDYADYSFAYDVLYFGSTFPYGEYFFDDDGNYINPSNYIQGKDKYTKQSHEIRISSPQDQRLRYLAGLFWQKQTHDIEQRYLVDDLATSLEVTGWPDTLWLTEQEREDEDKAVFGEVTYDLTEKLSATGGLRYFKYENSLLGFFGFGFTNDITGSTGEKSCEEDPPVAGGGINGGPCVNLNSKVDDTDFTHRLNLTYRIDEERMVYATWSTGYRPGGVNRRTSCPPTAPLPCVEKFPPYEADFLDNYEVGWKTVLLDGRLRFNGAVFWQQWDNFQYSFLGDNGLTNVTNAEGGATIPGIEVDLEWAATDKLMVGGGLMLLHPDLDGAFCEDTESSIAECGDGDFAPDSTTLPVTPEFKANLLTRYNYTIGNIDGALQASLVYQGSSRSALVPADEDLLGGKQDAYTIADISANAHLNNWTFEVFVDNLFDERAELYRYAQCDEPVCAFKSSTYTITNQPRTIGIRLGQKF